MAEYTELRNLFNDDTLRNRVTVATVIAANNLLSGTPSVAEQKFAELVATNPDSIGSKVLMFVLAENNGLTVTQIQQAGDTAIQNAVNSIVPNFVLALFG